MIRPLAAILIGTMVVGALHAWEIPEAWLERDPGPREVAAIVQTGATESWSAVSDTILPQVLAAYVRRPERAGGLYGWLLAGRWATLMGEPEAKFIPRWVDAINQAGAGHSNMEATYTPGDRALGEGLRTEFVSWALVHRPFLESFFGQLSPCDQVSRVFSILDRLHEKDPAAFERYSQLALAIALVYDVPPPPGWPHAQVGQSVLRRRLPSPWEAFDFFVKLDRQGKSLQRIASLHVGELRFLVDLAAPFDELAWAQANVRVPLAQLAEVYSMINYRHDRADGGAFVWREPAYTLPGILLAGGICVDQAYFATQCAKARGVPTMIFRGAGLDGRHAWFGYLDGRRRWQLDAGRPAGQKLVTGLAHDPQTWTDLTDHELKFLSDGFRSSTRFRQASVEEEFAEVFLERGNASAAMRAARRSVNYESRFLKGWQTYFAAAEAVDAESATVEAALREASLAFQKYPDLDQHFSSLLSRRLRARGESSAADHQDRMNARKFQDGREDLAFAQAREELDRAVTSQPLFEQLRIYRELVDLHGRGGGISFFDQVVRPFAMGLAGKGNAGEAVRVVAFAKGALIPAPGSLLEKEMNELSRSLRQPATAGP
ncbi:MAG: hypothetical protein KBA71_06515 [Opitutaceae bacterium]|nr:hypothetical protein [Opitutaceae bacterium]